MYTHKYILINFYHFAVLIPLSYDIKYIRFKYDTNQDRWVFRFDYKVTQIKTGVIFMFVVCVGASVKCVRWLAWGVRAIVDLKAEIWSIFLLLLHSNIYIRQNYVLQLLGCRVLALRVNGYWSTYTVYAGDKGHTIKVILAMQALNYR